MEQSTSREDLATRLFEELRGPDGTPPKRVLARRVGDRMYAIQFWQEDEKYPNSFAVELAEVPASQE